MQIQLTRGKNLGGRGDLKCHMSQISKFSVLKSTIIFSILCEVYRDRLRNLEEGGGGAMFEFAFSGAGLKMARNKLS